MITSQVVAAHRPPSPPPPAAAPDFRFCSGSGSALLPQLSTFLCCRSQNVHGASGGVATHSFPSSFCPSLLCACACSRPNGARCPLCTTCHRHPHPVWHRICRHRRVHACARTRSGLPPKRQWSPATATHIVFGIVYLYIKASIRRVVLHCSTSNIQTRIIRFLLRRGAHVAAAHACTNSKRQSIISHTKIAKA